MFFMILKMTMMITMMIMLMTNMVMKTMAARGDAVVVMMIKVMLQVWVATLLSTIGLCLILDVHMPV